MHHIKCGNNPQKNNTQEQIVVGKQNWREEMNIYNKYIMK